MKQSVSVAVSIVTIGSASMLSSILLGAATAAVSASFGDVVKSGTKVLQYTPMYTVWTEALLGTEPGKQRRALLRTTGDTPKGLSDCKTLLVDDAPHGLDSGYEDLCNKGSMDQRTYKTMIE
jgi:hypothetical protein